MWILILTFVAWNSGASVSMSEPVFTKESCMLAAKSYVEQTKDSGKKGSRSLCPTQCTSTEVTVCNNPGHSIKSKLQYNH